MGSEFHIKGGERILAKIKSFSATVKFIFGIFVLVIIISAISLALRVNDSFLIPIPAHGGEIREGIVGLPRSINPVLAFTDIDKDLSELVYSGLMKYNDGKLIPDLAKKYTISENGLIYTFTLKDDLRFHDGIPLTADDIEYTIQKIQDSTVNSPRRVDWTNILIKKISPTEIQFTLKQPYTPFLSNTTLGILPKHIWSKVSSDQFVYSSYNIEPIGSGPYKLDSIKRDKGGIPEYYIFSSFGRYHKKEAYISTLYTYFYPNEKSAVEAFANNIIQSIGGISPIEAEKIASTTSSSVILKSSLPRIFGVFFNQNHAPIFANAEVRKALDMAVDKDLVVQKVLLGYGTRNDSPLPKNISSIDKKDKSDIEGAKALLKKAGWELGENGVLQKKDTKGTQTLEFGISTAEAPDLKLAAEIVKEEWEKLGAKVTIKIFEYGDLYQNIIATRRYDALLFGEFIGKDIDLYAFWHSSQRNAPGLNVSLYVNSKVDKILEDIRTTSNNKNKGEKYKDFEKIIGDDVPAVFLYSPQYIYVVPKTLKGIEAENIAVPSDRFSRINTWYVTTDSVWKIFVN